MPRVSLSSKNQSFEVEEGKVLYDALADLGEDLPHGCLAGSCGACRIIIESGAENLKAPSSIEQNTIEAIKENYRKTKPDMNVDELEIRLSCRARVLGDVTIKPLA